MGPTRPLLVYFRYFHMTNIAQNCKWKKHRWCAWVLNPGWQDGRHRQIHWAMAAPHFFLSVSFSPWSWKLQIRKWVNPLNTSFAVCQVGHNKVPIVDCPTEKLLKLIWQTRIFKGGRPGLVVMGDNSCLRGCGFKFRHHILDGHDIFLHWFFVKIVLFCLKKLKINYKEAGVGPFLKNKE